MRILDKYIIKEFILPFLFGVIIFSGILLCAWPLSSMIKLMVNYNVNIITASKLLFLTLPKMIIFALPMSSLLGCVLALSRLSTDNEILAIKASGVSFISISLPLILLSVFIGIFSIITREVITPITNHYYHKIYIKEVVSINPKLDIKGQVFIKELNENGPKRFLYAEKYDKELNSLINVISLEFQEGKHTQTIKAQRARYINNSWIFYNGKLHNFDEKGNLKQILQFDKQKLKIDYNPDDILRHMKKEEEMTYREINAHINFLKKHGERNINELLVELYFKLSTSSAAIILALIGIPLGMRPRITTSIGIGVCAIIIFIYLVILNFSLAAGKIGTFHPLLAAFLPNIIFLIIGIILMLKQQKI